MAVMVVKEVAGVAQAHARVCARGVVAVAAVLALVLVEADATSPALIGNERGWLSMRFYHMDNYPSFAIC